MRFKSFSFGCKLFSASLLAATLLGCKGDDEGGTGQPDSFDRHAMLAHLADDLIIPGYADFSQATQALEASAALFADSLNTVALGALRAQWEVALRSWEKVGFYDIGPAMDIGLTPRTNAFPVDVTKIEANIASGTYNLETAGNIDAVGFQALDYLLFGTGDDPEAVVAHFESEPKAKTYLIDLTAQLASDAETVEQAWLGGYRDTFVQAAGTDIGSSVAGLVNGSLRYLEVNLRDAKIGIPAGARTSAGDPLPEFVEARYEDTVSKDLLISSVQAWRDMFNGVSPQGADGPGFDDYIAFLGADFDDGSPLQEAIDGYFASTLEKCQPLDASLATAVVTQQQQALDVFDELQRVVVLIKVDMTSAMGIQITFVDNDGD